MGSGVAGGMNNQTIRSNAANIYNQKRTKKGGNSMILGKIGIILTACVIEYGLINVVLDYFHDKKYGQQEKDYAEAMAYLKSFNKKEEF